MRYLVHILPADDDYNAFVPDLPGCVAAGSSIREVRDLIAEAMGLHIDLMKQSGERVPKPRRRFDLRVEDLVEGEMCTWIEVKEPQLV